MNDVRIRLSAIEKCRKRLPVLRANGASDADLARLLIEPIVRWIGYDPTSFQSVRREVRLVHFLPPISLVCLQNGEPALSIVLRPSLDERTIQAYGAALAHFSGRSGGAMRIAFTDGDEWRAYRVDNGARIISLFHASLAAPERLLSLGPAREAPDVSDVSITQAKPPTPAPAAPKVPPTPPAAVSPPVAAPPSRPAPPASASGPTSLGPRSSGPSAAASGVIRRPGGDASAEVRVPTPAPERPTARPTPPKVERDNARSYKYIREDETLTSPAYVEIEGRRQYVRRWVDVHMLAAAEHLRRKSGIPAMLFDKQRYPYASRQPDKLRRPRAVAGGWFVEANMNAHLACRVAAELLLRAGLSADNFDITYYPR